MAEQYTLESLLKEEQELVLPHFSEDDAIDLGLEILRRTRVHSFVIAFEVHRTGRLIFKASVAGTRQQNDVMLAGKSHVVERFAHSSMYERLRHEADGTTFQQATNLPFPEYTPYGGAVPIFVGGANPVGGPIGWAVVSGLTQEQDHALVVDSLRTVLHSMNGGPKAK